MIDSKLLNNFLSLSLLRGVTIIIPIITFPYLMNVLGSEKYGLVVWVWSIVNLFVVITRFGFDITITKRIAQNKNSKDRLDDIVSQAYWAKFCLMIFSFLIYLIIVNTFPSFYEYEYLFYISFLLVLGEFLTPLWYFQGLERMRITAILTSSIKLFFSLMVFLVIKNKFDYEKVIMLYALSAIFSGFVGAYIIFFIDNIKLKRFDSGKVILNIKESIPVFLSSSLSTLKDSLTIMLLEKYLGFNAVTIFDLVNKVVSVLITPFHILSAVLYPRIAMNQDYKMLFKWLIKTLILTVLLSTVVCTQMNTIIDLLHIENFNTPYFFYTMISSVVLFNLCSMLGTCGLAAFGKTFTLLKTTLFSISIYLLCLFVFITLGLTDLISFSIAILISAFIEAISRYYYVRAFYFRKALQ